MCCILTVCVVLASGVNAAGCWMWQWQVHGPQQAGVPGKARRITLHAFSLLSLSVSCHALCDGCDEEEALRLLVDCYFTLVSSYSPLIIAITLLHLQVCQPYTSEVLDWSSNVEYPLCKPVSNHSTYICFIKCDSKLMAALK